MLGTRGIPANYGGFETCVEEIAPRMAALGHEVTVYCRTPKIDYPGDRYRGVRLVKLPTIQNKYLDTIFHSTLSAIHALREQYDVVIVFGVGNSPVCAILRAGRMPVMLNVNGLDWMRDKWPEPAKILLRAAEKIAVRVPNRVITDSRNVRRYYKNNRGIELDYIPYGASPDEAVLNGQLNSLGLKPNSYFLYVGRLEPENRVHDLVAASNAANVSIPTVIVGDAPYSEVYIDRLQRLASDQVMFPGSIYGPGYWELNHFAYTYVFPVLSSGTHPALIEAMACQNCVLVRDTPDNRDVGGDAVRYYSSVDELAELMRWAESAPEDVREYGRRAARRSAKIYDWDRVTNDYLNVASEIVDTGPSTGSSIHLNFGPSATVDDHHLSEISVTTDVIRSLVFDGADSVSDTDQIQLDYFAWTASMHGVGPLLGRRVQRGDLTINTAIDSWLTEQAQFNVARIEKLKRELACVLDAAEFSGIEVIPVKGAALLLDQTKDVAWRPFADLDLLTREDETRKIDLSLAHAGYCLKEISWKHRVYGPCDGGEPVIHPYGEHPDNPRGVEIHQAVVEMFRGFRWDLTPWIINNLTNSQGGLIPDSRALALHLTAHASNSILESTARMIQIVDLINVLDRDTLQAIVTAAEKSGIEAYARFVFPALAFTARWTDCTDLEETVQLLESHVPDRMVEWINSVSFHDVSWAVRHHRPTLDRNQIWANSTSEYLRMLRATALPAPLDLAGADYSGDGPFAIPGWYKNHYRQLIRRTVSSLS